MFYATCPAGLETLAPDMARGYTSVRQLGGALLFESKEKLPRHPVFQNVYQVIAQYKADRNLDGAAARLRSDRGAIEKARALMAEYGFRSCRYMFSDQNKLVSVNAGVRSALERELKGVVIDRVSPETELLLLKRSEGMILFLMRLTKHASNDKRLQKGELSQAIASCMVHLACPGPEGIFLDPFAGTGAVGEARVMAGKASKVLLYDIDRSRMDTMRAKRALGRGGVTIAVQDALKLYSVLKEASVTEIATDPPWGIYEPLSEEAQVFYRDMLAQFAFVLADRGHLCVLTADKDNFEKAAGEEKHFAFSPRTDILVNGKKAALYSAVRVPRK